MKIMERKTLLTGFREEAFETIRLSVLWASSVAKFVGIQPTDLFAIAHLLGVTTATAGELRDVSGLSSGATTAMINRLEAAGVVKREADKRDGRRVIVRLIAPPPSVVRLRHLTERELKTAMNNLDEKARRHWSAVHVQTSTAINRVIDKLKDEKTAPPRQGAPSERNTQK
jgi:predicted transcriptional regulator